jgi:hypothetical protein
MKQVAMYFNELRKSKQHKDAVLLHHFESLTEVFLFPVSHLLSYAFNIKRSEIHNRLQDRFRHERQKETIPTSVD